MTGRVNDELLKYILFYFMVITGLRTVVPCVCCKVLVMSSLQERSKFIFSYTFKLLQNLSQLLRNINGFIENMFLLILYDLKYLQSYFIRNDQIHNGTHCPYIKVI